MEYSFAQIREKVKLFYAAGNLLILVAVMCVD